MRQALRNLMIQRGLKLVLGSFLSVFVGYTLPIAIVQLDVNPLDELVFACMIDLRVAGALLQWDLKGTLVALAEPALREPIWLALGRYALAIGVAGTTLILLAVLMTLPGRLWAAWRGLRLRPEVEPSAANFEDPDDARRRMGRRK